MCKNRVQRQPKELFLFLLWWSLLNILEREVRSAALGEVSVKTAFFTGVFGCACLQSPFATNSLPLAACASRQLRGALVRLFSPKRENRDSFSVFQKKQEDKFSSSRPQRLPSSISGLQRFLFLTYFLPVCV